MNKLGFGFLRLPVTPAGEIDLSLLDQMTDVFLAHGQNYFDTAYTYLDGKSEWAIRESLVKRHPRSSFLLADKLPGYKMTSHEDCYRYFKEQQDRCQVDFFDVYLLHWLNGKHYEIAEKYREFEFLEELKKTGKAIKTGFSYHDSANLLDEILTRHPEVDYVQLQINYLDWESSSIQSRRCYETAVKHGKKVIVMEPVKGGALAALPEKAGRLLEKLSPDASQASYAIRFAESLPQVEIVLSGMNTMEQLLDNLACRQPLTEYEQSVLFEDAGLLRNSIAVPCTGCGYCVSGCPKKIHIPEYFRLYNEYKQNPGDGWKIAPVYQNMTASGGGPADCIGCKKCEGSCPQTLPITKFLSDVREAFDDRHS